MTISTKRFYSLERGNNKINKYLKNKKYVALPLSKRMIGNAVSHCGISYYAAKVMIAAAIQTFLNNIGYNLPDINERVAKACTPSRGAIADYVDETAAEKLAWFRREIRGKVLFGSFDKGHKKGIGHLVKFIAFWCDTTDMVQVYLLDCEASEGTSFECARAINFSMTRLDAEGFFAQLSGQNTDAGGGGVCKSLECELLKVNRVKIGQYTYLRLTCSQHGHQLTLGNPMKKLLGEGQLNRQNVSQLLHSVYNLQEGGGGAI